MVFKHWVKNIQTDAYIGASTVTHGPLQWFMGNYIYSRLWFRLIKQTEMMP